MFKGRSPFQIPQVPGTSLRRKEEERNRYEMSIEKPREESKAKQMTPSISMTSSPTIQALPSTVDEKFCFELSEPISQQEQEVYWSYELENVVSNEVSRKIIFREQQYYVRSTGDSQILQTIYITAENVQGFKNKDGVATNRVCALHLTSMNSLFDDSADKTYDLLYKQTQDYSWELPMNLGSIRMGIQFDDVQQSGSLSVPLVCQFDIRHTAR